MANNYTQATLVPEVRLDAVLSALLRATGATIEPGDAEGESYVYWEESFEEIVDPERLADYLDEDAFAEGWDAEPQEKLIERWADREMAEILRAVLELNPGIEFLHLEGAHMCSKMRAGEFGGFGLWVTRQQYVWINSGGSIQVKDGRLEPQFTIEDFPEVA